MKKNAALALISCLSLSVVTTSTVMANEQKADFEQTELFGEKYSVKSEVTDNNVIYETISESGERNVFIYDRSSKTATLNGDNIELRIEKFEDPNLSHINVKMASTPYTPVYVNTQTISFNDIVNSISAIATLIGGIISVANLIGLALPSIAGVIGDWAGAVGLGSLAAGWYCSGGFTYNLYRTTGAVQVSGALNPQIAYRYQNCSVNFAVKGKSMSYNYSQVGSWWYASNPY